MNLYWLEGPPPLYDNKEMAQTRLRNTVRSLESANRLNESQEFFNQWDRISIIEQINPDNDISEGLGVHFLPHRSVLKDNSTTK
ncbi:uncharacterized protein NPIL_156011, partial [Nephila pilipes]